MIPETRNNFPPFTKEAVTQIMVQFGLEGITCFHYHYDDENNLSKVVLHLNDVTKMIPIGDYINSKKYNVRAVPGIIHGKVGAEITITPGGNPLTYEEALQVIMEEVLKSGISVVRLGDELGNVLGDVVVGNPLKTPKSPWNN